MVYRSMAENEMKQVVSLFEQTFSDSEGRKEGLLISELARELIETTAPEHLRVCVAALQQELSGCIMFTRLWNQYEQNLWLLSPVAVKTAYQAKGIGQRLISHGLDELRVQECSVAVTYGDIRFYSKVGFSQINEAVIKAPLRLSYPEGWLAQRLDGKPLTPIPGETKCVKALDDPRYW